MIVPNQFIQDILAKTDIVDLIGRYVPLRKTGINFTGLCPFHNERSPSFTVSVSKQFYHCFGCGVSGSALGFLMEYSGYTFLEAVEELAKLLGLTVPMQLNHNYPLNKDKETEYKQSLIKNNTLAALFYKQALKKSTDKAIKYLKKRGISGQIAAKYDIGYAPNHWQALKQYVSNYQDKSWLDCGLVIEKKTESTQEISVSNHKTPINLDYTINRAIDSTILNQSNENSHLISIPVLPVLRKYDRFRDRIMFPIRSMRGEIIGFGGRVIDQNEPKYLNSPETVLFNKSYELYGLYEARMAIKQTGYVIVTEGYVDVIALAQFGFENTVATLGTAISVHHIQKLFKYTDHIVCSFDGDKAGQKAAWRALEVSLPILTEVRHVSFLFLPSHHDPDSFIRQEGTSAFAQAIQTAQPLSQVLLNTVLERHNINQIEGRTALLHEVKPLLQAIQCHILRLQLIKGLANLSSINVSEIEQFIGLPSSANTHPIHTKIPPIQSNMNLNTHSNQYLNTHLIHGDQENMANRFESSKQAVKPWLSKSDWLNRKQKTVDKSDIRRSTGALSNQPSHAYLLGLILLQASHQFTAAYPWLKAWMEDIDWHQATVDEKKLILLCNALTDWFKNHNQSNDNTPFSHNNQSNPMIESVNIIQLTQYLHLQTEQEKHTSLDPLLKQLSLKDWLHAAYSKQLSNTSTIAPADTDALRLAVYLRYTQLQYLCRKAADSISQSNSVNTVLETYTHLKKQEQAAYLQWQSIK